MTNDSHHMLPSEMHAACEKIYGTKRWQTKLAKDLVRDREIVSRWARGVYSPPKRVQEWIRKRLAQLTD